MHAHSFMLADLAGSLLAVCLFPLFVVAPGFAIAWAMNLFDFRSRTGPFQFTLSLPLSIALCPALTYLGGRFASMTVVWAFYAACWIACLAIVIRYRLPRLPNSRTAFTIAGVWTLIAILSLIDLQIGHRAWFPSAAFDYSVRSQFIQSIGQTGIPPANPFYFPGHAVPLRYHYFWLLLCSLVDRAGGEWVSARQAWFGGVVWIGLGLMAMVALYFRLFDYRGPATYRRRTLTGVFLLAVGGLDIIPTALLWMLQAAGMHGVLPSMEWWNEQVDSFVYTAIWESHYLAGLIACLTAFLILWHTPRWRNALLAGIALASAAGASIYVVFVFALFVVVWMAVTIHKRWWRECALLAVSGVIGLLLFAPYLKSLRGPAGGGPAMQFWIRPFYPVDAIFRGQAFSNWAVNVVNAASLPINYFFELGVFLAAALLWWQRRRRARQPLTRPERALVALIGVSVFVCTFVRSSVIGNNDLGWRGFLLAQFGLLLITADVVAAWNSDTIRRQRVLLTALMVLGLTGSIYELGINRFYPLLSDRGTVAPVSWIANDRQAGARNYALREAAEWAGSATAPSAMVQWNPHVEVQDTSAYLYSMRPRLAADDGCQSSFGGDPALCAGLIATLNHAYPLAGQSADPNLAAVCGALPVEVLAALDTDAAWRDPASWVWQQPPAFANNYVRLFRCSSSSTARPTTAGLR